MPLLPPAVLLAVLSAFLYLSGRRCGLEQKRRPDAVDAHLRNGRRLSLVAGCIAAGASALWGCSLGVGLMLSPAMLSAITLAGMFVTEATAPREIAERRVARLTPRAITDFLSPARLAVALGVWVLVTAAAVFGWATGSADDLGREGRTVAWKTSEAWGSAGPWPGSYYAVPLVIAEALALGCLVGMLRRAAVRPEVNLDGVPRDAGRRVTAMNLGWSVFVGTCGIELVGLGLAMAMATASVPSGSLAWAPFVHWAALAGVLLGVGAAVSAIAVAARRETVGA